MVTGTTDSKLSQIATYNLDNPYKVGINGVTNIVESTLGSQTFLKVYYNIDGIEYTTTTRLTIKNNNGVLRKTQQESVVREIVKKGDFYVVREKNSNNDTTFKSFLSGFDFINYPAVKDEEKIGQVFLPEIKDEIFIERMTPNIFERHSRLEDINNIEQLENYKNGFFNVTKR